MRHADVENPQGVIYGHLPGFRLSELGGAQAAAVGQSLRDRRIRRIVHSPLDRARETAEIVNAQLPNPVPLPQGIAVALDADQQLEKIMQSVEKIQGDGAAQAAVRPRVQPGIAGVDVSRPRVPGEDALMGIGEPRGAVHHQLDGIGQPHVDVPIAGLGQAQEPEQGERA